MSDRLRGAGVALFLCAAWIAAALAVNPVGDFPMVDDWAYVPSVQALLAGKGFIFSDWAAGNLVSHILWGAMFGAVFGPTPTVLRISTLVAGLMGAFAIYRLFRLAKAGRGVALLATATSVFNPLYFNLAFSFMTDVTYSAMQFVAMWLIASGVLFRRPLVQAAGWLTGLTALFCRQLGLFIPAGFAGEAVLRRPWDWRRVLLALAPLLLFGLAQLAFQFWLGASGRGSAHYGRQISEMVEGLGTRPGVILVGALQFPGYCFFYLGLFCLPVSLYCVPKWRALLPPSAGRWAPLLLALLALAITVGEISSGQAFPMWRDTLNGLSGMGVENMGTPMPIWLRLALTLASSFGGLLLVAALAASAVTIVRRRSDGFDIAVFAASTALCLLAPVAFVEMRFDRYLAPILPCVLLALSPLLTGRGQGRTSAVLAAAALIMMAGWSIGGTHDSLQAKRVQWRAYTELLKTIPADHIDAGWVLNGAMSFGKYGTVYDLNSWYERADYKLTAFEPPGYAVVSRHPVERWLPWNWSGSPIIVSRRLVTETAP